MIGPDEQIITGEWKVVDNAVDGDANEYRICDLIEGYLTRIVSDKSGWETLYIDPQDGRYWELIYRHGDWHGGGPRQLICLSDEAARLKFGLLSSETGTVKLPSSS